MLFAPVLTLSWIQTKTGIINIVFGKFKKVYLLKISTLKVFFTFRYNLRIKVSVPNWMKGRANDTPTYQ